MEPFFLKGLEQILEPFCLNPYLIKGAMDVFSFGSLIALFLFAYLVYALLYPEKF